MTPSAVVWPQPRLQGSLFRVLPSTPGLGLAQGSLGEATAFWCCEMRGDEEGLIPVSISTRSQVLGMWDTGLLEGPCS